ncbi:type II toxin-antitoxin system HicA family toxin [Vibrio echinoideorum]
MTLKLENNKGSKRKFVHEEKRIVISLHEPHPEKTLKRYVIESVIL